MKFKELDPVFLNQLRLQILTLLIVNKTAEFTYIAETTNATVGNLSTQIKILSDAGYLQVTKTFKKNRPNTSLKITAKGVKSYETYVENLKSYFERK